MSGPRCECGKPIYIDDWDYGMCAGCLENEEERSRKRREWEAYHDEPCPEIELPPRYRKTDAA